MEITDSWAKNEDGLWMLYYPSERHLIPDQAEVEYRPFSERNIWCAHYDKENQDYINNLMYIYYKYNTREHTIEN